MKKVKISVYKKHLADNYKSEIKKALEYSEHKTEKALPEEVKTKCMFNAKKETAKHYEIKFTNLDHFDNEDQEAYAEATDKLKKKGKFRKCWVAVYDENGDLTGVEIELQFGIYCNRSGRSRKGTSPELKDILLAKKEEAEKASQKDDKKSEEVLDEN